MAVSTTIEAAINQQINYEITAAYNYLAMAAWFERDNLPGFAGWMMIQRSEELDHAMRLYKFLMDRHGKLDLGALGKPRHDYKNVEEIFVAAQQQEVNNTRAIHNLYELAINEKDWATQSFLKWFIDEQVEEEKVMSEALGLIHHAGDNHSALLMLDQRLGTRSAK
ncbi:MAG: ferritin [Phycisphaeraceae bacterium]|nr:ferritin [Phycisphaeraceae bacterium]